MGGKNATDNENDKNKSNYSKSRDRAEERGGMLIGNYSGKSPNHNNKKGKKEGGVKKEIHRVDCWARKMD